jgi:hypothetical protein
MKTFIYKSFLAVVLVVALSACSKKNDNQPAAASSFTLTGTNYPAATVIFTNNSLLAIAKSNSQVTIGLLFKSRPAAGSYPVVGNVTINGGCAIQATGTGGNSYSSLNNNSGKVLVAITNGKIHATFSGATLINEIDQSAATVSGDLTEQ